MRSIHSVQDWIEAFFSFRTPFTVPRLVFAAMLCTG